jgi:HemY protein
MRAALWLISLFALAAAGCLAGGEQPGHGDLVPVAVPDRFVAQFGLAGVSGGVGGGFGSAGLVGFVVLASTSQRWRLQQKERAAHAAMLDPSAISWRVVFCGPARPRN